MLTKPTRFYCYFGFYYINDYFCAKVGIKFCRFHKDLCVAMQNFLNDSHANVKFKLNCTVFRIEAAIIKNFANCKHFSLLTHCLNTTINLLPKLLRIWPPLLPRAVTYNNKVPIPCVTGLT